MTPQIYMSSTFAILVIFSLFKANISSKSFSLKVPGLQRALQYARL
jgi:hypothetical protein